MRGDQSGLIALDAADIVPLNRVIRESFDFFDCLSDIIFTKGGLAGLVGGNDLFCHSGFADCQQADFSSFAGGVLGSGLYALLYGGKIFLDEC